MKKQYLKPVTEVIETEGQVLLSGSTKSDINWSPDGETKINIMQEEDGDDLSDLG